MSKRQQLKEQRRRKGMITNILWGSSLLILFSVVGYVMWSSATTPPKPPATGTPAQATLLPAASMVGQAVAVDPDRGHIDDNTDPGAYTTNPPTSGHHYATWKQAGFYEANTDPYPQGYLVHNLEHGYIIFWYNCTILSETECTELKAQIRTVMDGAGNFKVIAYPWDQIDVPLVMTSWGYTLSMETFNAEQATIFIEQHRNRAPEPEAP
jgi:hypothetical protein